MRKNIVGMTVLLLVALVGPVRANSDRPMYGYELMTFEERWEYGERLRNATTPEARMRLVGEHEQWIDERAAKRGLVAPRLLAERGYGGPWSLGPGMAPRMDTGPGAVSGPGAGPVFGLRAEGQ